MSDRPTLHLVSLLGLLAVPAWAGAAELRGVQISMRPDATRVEVTLSAETRFKFFTLDNPARAVLDLRDTPWSKRLKQPGAEGLVRAIRMGPQPHGALRVVIDLGPGTRSRLLDMARGSTQSRRFVIDLSNASVATADDDSKPERDSLTRQSVANQPAPAAPAVPAMPAAPAVRAAHAPRDATRDLVIAIDAGHGGTDPGASGRRGTQEKDVVLGIAKALAERINREPGMHAVLTRDGDYFITLRQRIQRARAAKADMFVSVHADSIRDRDVAGSSVYVLSEKGSSDEQARWLAERENAADLKGGVSLDDKDNTLASVLLDLSNTANMSASMLAAERVLQALRRVGEVRKPRVQQAGFVVLKSPDIPSMLVETAYISNPADENHLRSAEHRTRVAEAIFSGVERYFAQNPPDGSRFAQLRHSSDVASTR